MAGAGKRKRNTHKARATAAPRKLGARAPTPARRSSAVHHRQTGSARSANMSDKKTPSADADRNVDQIRDILFGGQMRDYERRFGEIAQRLEQEAARLRTEMEKRLSNLEKRLDEQVDKLGKQLRQEIGDRGKAVDDLESRTLQAARTARNEISGAIEQLQGELAEADERERKAIGEIGAALKKAAADADAALLAARHELRGDKVGREDLAALLTEVALRLKGDFDLPKAK
jgi:hypothetical protein